jgi:hypothetical protein
MGISIYYTARRGHGLTDAERRQVDAIVAEENAALYKELDALLPAWWEDGAVPAALTSPQEICEGISLYDPERTDPGVVLQGSSKVSHSACDSDPMMFQLDHYMRSGLARLRRAVPGAEWDVHIDDTYVEWEEEAGAYVFPAS